MLWRRRISPLLVICVSSLLLWHIGQVRTQAEGAASKQWQMIVVPDCLSTGPQLHAILSPDLQAAILGFDQAVHTCNAGRGSKAPAGSTR